jgi:pimeloyl-ACP methyl ester carboxylesterase
MRLQQGLARLSPRGELVVANGSGHDVAIDRPALVIAAVKKLAEGMAGAK